MARNGAGTYSLYPVGNPVVTGSTISSSWANGTLNDIATALTQSIAYDGQTTPVANLPMGNFAHTNVSNATVRTMYSSMGQVQDGVASKLFSVSGADTITANVSFGMSAYVAGQVFVFIAVGTNTGAATININSIGAKSITKNGTTALAAGDIVTGGAYEVIYDGTQFQLVNANPVTAVESVSGGTTGFYMASTTAVTATISSGTPAVLTVGSSSDVPANNTQITLKTTGTLPTGLSTNTIYYVVNASTTTFNVSLTSGGSAINTTAAGSGTHSFELLKTTGALEMAGIVNITNGGTGTSSLKLNNLFLGNGTSAIKNVPAGTTNNVLTSTQLSSVNAGSFVTGTEYTIATVGTTDFVGIGAASNTVGVVFTATGAGSGSGVATTNIWASAANNKLTSATVQATTSGTTVSFTGIPSWVKRITVMLSGVSASGSDNITLKMGTSGGYESSGYSGVALVLYDGQTTIAGNTFSTYISLTAGNSTGSNTTSGQFVLSLIDAATYKWVVTGQSSPTSSGTSSRQNIVTGTKTLAGVLDSLQIGLSGSNTFDAGSVNIMYE